MAMMLNNGICRCCSSEGTFKDVKSKYHWMGEEEVYADMLKDCFDISLYMEDCEDSGICEVCITQLRNAANFKKQVLHTEQQFLKVITKKTIEVPLLEAEIKIENTKDEEEIEAKDEEEIEARFEEEMDLSDHFADGEDMNDPDFVPELKEEQIEEPKPKKRVKATASTSSVKKPAAERKTSRRSTTTRVITIKPKPKVEIAFAVKRTSIFSKQKLENLRKNRHNLRNILLNSNASPFGRHGDHGYMCSGCPIKYEEAANLKDHFLKEHKSEKPIDNISRKFRDRAVKLDVTNLCCSLCNKDFMELEELIKHLGNEHDKEVYTDVKSQLLPFKFDSPALRCALCQQEYHNFKLLQDHMKDHYNNYVCETCKSKFVTENLLRKHMKAHEAGVYKCEQCDKVFQSDRKRREHLRRTHLGFSKLNACKFCDKRFSNYYQMMDHTVKDHGAKPVALDCKACGRIFNNTTSLTVHTRKDHLMERKYECSECDTKCFDKKSLRKHLVKHTGERKFKCEICSKAYTRNCTLREHMRIHRNEKRYSCSQCGQAFNKKCRWKNHMHSKHGEVV